MVTKGTPVTLRFKYSGVLVTPSGGPLLTKRLAYVGERNGYLMYAARWFPFHEYAADQATSEITINLPADFQVVGYSDNRLIKKAAKPVLSAQNQDLSGISRMANTPIEI